MNMRTPVLALRRHACAGPVWVLDFDARGQADCAFCAARAARPAPASPPPLGRLTAALRDELARRRRLPDFVHLLPSADAFAPGAADLAPAALEACQALLARDIGVVLSTRGGLAQAQPLVTLARRFPGLLRVHVGVFSPDARHQAMWERGAAPLADRVALAGALQRAGAQVVMAIGPIIPFVNDAPEALERLVRMARHAGVTAVQPHFVQDAPGLVAQVEREVARSQARMLEGWFAMPGARIAPGVRRIADRVVERPLEALRQSAQRAGVQVQVCACQHSAGADVCLRGPVRAAAPAQLGLLDLG